MSKRINIWNTLIKQIEGGHGTVTASYFVLMRWLLLYNFFIGIMLVRDCIALGRRACWSRDDGQLMYSLFFFSSTYFYLHVQMNALYTPLFSYIYIYIPATTTTINLCSNLRSLKPLLHLSNLAWVYHFSTAS